MTGENRGTPWAVLAVGVPSHPRHVGILPKTMTLVYVGRGEPQNRNAACVSTTSTIRVAVRIYHLASLAGLLIFGDSLLVWFTGRLRTSKFTWSFLRESGAWRKSWLKIEHTSHL